MSKQTIIGRLSERFSEPPEQTAEEIDRELEQAVAAIKSEKLQTLEGKKVLSGSDSAEGGKVYIMDLKPMYALLGGSEGRVAENLREACHREFAQRSVPGRDRASRENDLFVMRFAGISEQEAFSRAAIIVNTIGIDLLGSRFETLEVPNLLVATPAAGAFNADGSANLEAMRAAVESGGTPVTMDKPGDDAPHWIKLRWKKELQSLELRAQSLRPRTETAARAARSPLQYVKRQIGDRRKLTKSISGRERRKILDRRGRGY